MEVEEILKGLELSGGIVITGNSRRVTNFLAALDEATEILKRIDTDGCVGCKYEDVPPHRPPCNECKRNCHDFGESEEKQIAKKPIFDYNLSDTLSKFHCECGNTIKVSHDVGIMDNNNAPNYCSKCGCRLDWSEEE